MNVNAEALRGYIDYLRDLGIYDMYRVGAPSDDAEIAEWWGKISAASAPAGAASRPGGAPAPPSGASARPPQASQSAATHRPGPSAPPPAPRAAATRQSAPFPATSDHPPVVVSTPNHPPAPATAAHAYDFDEAPPVPPAFQPPAMPLTSFNQLAPLPAQRVPPAGKAAALQQLRDTIGDCTRCPLAYAGRHTIVFADGDPNASLMFVGEGPGADEDESGVPFVGKAGQLLNNMITAMGLKREQVYIANIVKCRPPKNRVPEPVEANTCSPFLLQQIDIVQPKVIVALGATAATYLLGVRSPLAGLRGKWHDVRGAKTAVTFHPAFLLRDPRQKGEAWKDLQRVMVELGLTPPSKASSPA